MGQSWSKQGKLDVQDRFCFSGTWSGAFSIDDANIKRDYPMGKPNKGPFQDGKPQYKKLKPFLVKGLRRNLV